MCKVHNLRWIITMDDTYKVRLVREKAEDRLGGNNLEPGSCSVMDAPARFTEKHMIGTSRQTGRYAN